MIKLLSQDLLWVRLSRKCIRDTVVKKAQNIGEYEDLTSALNDINELVKAADQECEENLKETRGIILI